MADTNAVTAIGVLPVERPINLIPVGLKEAALDSPTFRATAVHFADQVDVVERWLENYVRSVARLTSEVVQFESAVNAFLSQSIPPAGLSEAVIDHDYALLAMRRFGEGARESWSQTLKGVKRYDAAVVEPIKALLNGELRTFKDARRALDTNQKIFDGVIARYLGQSKTKEASSLREDAFQVHEARKAYLKASLDYSTAGPLLRDALDKLLVRIYTEQWKEVRMSRESTASVFSKLNTEMERIRGWSKEMENSERAFRRELLAARKQIEENAAVMIKPSRDLADYETSTVPYLGTATGTNTGKALLAKAGTHERGEKQGWLFMKAMVGRPARIVWYRRWFFVKNGIFGFLAQGGRPGGVEESEKTGVLLCGIKPAFQEERRFCFEVKTKDTSIVLQAETQTELSEWIGAFEVAKKRALEDPRSIESSPLSPGLDPAFAITPPISAEFAIRTGDAQADRAEDNVSSLAAPDSASAARASFDVGASARRVTSLEKESEGSRDHAARIIQKLDLHKRGNQTAAPTQPTAPMGGGIASLISASHNVLPVGPGALPPPVAADVTKKGTLSYPASTLAPATLANPPAPTNLSHTAVLVSSERGISLGGRTDGSGMPGGIMANLWGSSNWGYVNRLGDETRLSLMDDPPPSRGSILAGSIDDVGVMDGMVESPKDKDATASSIDVSSSSHHRKTISAATVLDAPLPGQVKSTLEEGEAYPSNYPLALKAQNSQFRILFPSVSRTEKLVLVFRATWNPNEQQEFPGRVYVTEKEIYFYSHYLGLVLITGVSFRSISEVTAAPGRDCDFLYLLLRERGGEEGRRRITVRVFLDSLKLLQRRLAFLVANANSTAPVSLEETLKTLLKMETEEPKRSLSVDSWEDLDVDADVINGRSQNDPAYQRERNIKTSLRIDGDLYADAAKTGREVQRFQLPRHPVIYAPQGMEAGVTREFNVSAKALFHVIFGDRSAVFQLLYGNRWADKIVQTPWVRQPAGPEGRWTRRFSSQDNSTPMADTQTIDVMNDHLCYVVTHYKQPWRLPYSKRFHLITKLVITHSSKSRSKFAVFQSVVWSSSPTMSYCKTLVEKQALNSLQADALDLTTVTMDQVSKLANHSKTNKAIEIFGNIGQQLTATQIDPTAMPNLAGPIAAAKIKARRPVSMASLIASDMLIRLYSLMGMLFDILLAIGKGAIGLFTAHTALVVLLLTSVLYNGWFGYRDGLSWWHERAAGKYMSRLGVKPEPMISRGVYLTDIEEIVRPNIDNVTADAFTRDVQVSKTCRTTFSDFLDTSSAADGSVASSRLRRSRGSLAKYRHDLLVALRVVNRVEKDIVLEEWEEWVRREEYNCGRVEGMLRRQAQDKQSGKSRSKDANQTDIDAVLGPEFAAYCESCRNELGEIGKGISLI